MEKVIAMQSPAWPIETQGAYNTVNIGFIANEIVRRVTDKSIQNFIADEITKPLGVDYYLGVPENALDRCAEIIANPADQVRAAGRDPDSPVVAAWKAFPENFGPTEQNSYRMANPFLLLLLIHLVIWDLAGQELLLFLQRDYLVVLYLTIKVKVAE